MSIVIVHFEIMTMTMMTMKVIMNTCAEHLLVAFKESFAAKSVNDWITNTV